jgi:hypothetical protein
MAEVDAKQVNKSSRMKWDASLTFDGNNFKKTEIDEGDRSPNPLVRISQSLSRWKLVHRAYVFP